MKKIFYTIITAALLALSCQKESGTDNNNPEPEIPETEAVGTYVFDGEEYPVYSMSYGSNDNSIMIRISPLDKPIGEQTTYAIIGISTALEGENINVETAWNNDDYFFRYEDPVRYYSEYRKLLSGSINIRRTGGSEDTFDISVDVVLPDGTDFSFEYQGQIASATL